MQCLRVEIESEMRAVGTVKGFSGGLSKGVVKAELVAAARAASVLANEWPGVSFWNWTFGLRPRDTEQAACSTDTSDMFSSLIGCFSHELILVSTTIMPGGESSALLEDRASSISISNVVSGLSSSTPLMPSGL